MIDTSVNEIEVLVKLVVDIGYTTEMPDVRVPIINFEREAIERARAMTDAQRLIAGAELFDAACMISKLGIRSDHPEYSEEQVLDELRRRIRLGQRVRNIPDDGD